MAPVPVEPDAATTKARQEGGLGALQVMQTVLDRRMGELRRLQDAAGDAYGVANGMLNYLGAIRTEVEISILKALTATKVVVAADAESLRTKGQP
jgi:hypothetical protein